MRAIIVAIAALLAVAVAAPLTEEQYQSLFSRFVSQYDKNYETNEFFGKYNTFKANLDTVMAHNAQGLSWTQSMNEFGDLTAEEFTAKMGLKAIKAPVATALNTFTPKRDSNVSKVDWVKKGLVNPIKNQGQCGSCWAFSANAALETSYAVKTGDLLDLSESELVDCSRSYGNNGCRGGLMTQAYEYITDNGITTTDEYPYVPKDQPCKSAGTTRAVQTTGYKNLATTETALKAAAEKTVVAVAVDATQLQFYSGGIINEGCSGRLNHGVALVAFDDDEGTYTVRNSWGTTWGEKGYYRAKQGINALCMTKMNTIPLV